MKMKLRNQFIYGECRLYPDCPEAEALFELMKPKKHIVPIELPLLVKMGYEYEITGGTKGLAMECKSRDIPAHFHITNGRIEKITGGETE